MAHDSVDAILQVRNFKSLARVPVREHGRCFPDTSPKLAEQAEAPPFGTPPQAFMSQVRSSRHRGRTKACWDYKRPVPRANETSAPEGASNIVEQAATENNVVEEEHAEKTQDADERQTSKDSGRQVVTLYAADKLMTFLSQDGVMNEDTPEWEELGDEKEGQKAECHQHTEPETPPLEAEAQEPLAVPEGEDSPPEKIWRKKKKKPEVIWGERRATPCAEGTAEVVLSGASLSLSAPVSAAAAAAAAAAVARVAPAPAPAVSSSHFCAVSAINSPATTDPTLRP
ncbi:hypothetical protein CDD83_7081 [Cordyceps sp. RAO-2017]|nr:hypothetical protein CDD83_7081 [Cordyceps sp. RAO-2017]